MGRAFSFADAKSRKNVDIAGSPTGTRRACTGCVVRDFRALLCWQLAYQLKCEVFEFTAIGPASKDFKYRDQIRDSSACAPRNISEGFGRYAPGEFAQFLGYARASLMETQNHVIDGRDRRYLDDRLSAQLANLAKARCGLRRT